MADAPYSAVDLSRLPSPQVIETLDFETILAGAVDRMKEEMANSGLEFVSRDSDPATKLLQTFSYFALLLRQRINDAARAVMPAYAVGADLDNLAALFGITRFVITPADTALGIPAVMESDTDFRRRMVLAPEGYSVAGPEGAYISLAISASSEVLDASATSPAPGEVLISVLTRTGSGEASPDLVATVADYLTDATRRPLTDFVTVQSAQIVEYAVVASLTTFNGPDANIILETAQASLADYIAQTHQLGRDVTLSALYRALHVEGVQNVALTSPTHDIIVSRTQAPHCVGATVTIGGTGE